MAAHAAFALNPSGCAITRRTDTMLYKGSCHCARIASEVKGHYAMVVGSDAAAPC
jgi:hypothetical protein